MEAVTPVNKSEKGKRKRFFPLLIIGTVVTGLVAAIGWAIANDPHRLLKRAEVVCESDPIQGLALVDSCIKAAGGRFTEAQLLKCRVLIKRGRASDAAAVFSEITDWPDNQRKNWIPRLKEFVDAEYEATEEKLALEHCQKFAQLVPESPVPWMISASILHMNSEVLRALEAYRNAIARELPPQEKLRISYQIVTLSLHAGDISSARAQLDKLLKLAHLQKVANEKSVVSDADDHAFQVLSANVLYREGANDEALKVLDEVLARWPNSPGGHLLRGTVFFDQEKYQDAINDLNVVVSQNPVETKALYKLGQAYLALKQPDKAQPYLDRSHELTLVQVKIRQMQEEYFSNPANQQMALQLARLCEQCGDQGLAEYWRRAAARAPGGSLPK